MREKGGVADIDAVLLEFDRLAAEYPDYLTGAFDDAGVEVVDAPTTVGHLELVERAASRRPPCDQKGNGYRDTLNWLLIIDFLRQSPSESLTFVTADNHFRGPDGELHAELAAELSEIDAGERFRLVKR